ncbi:hypothetical protein ECE50_009895 [Chitinophaga sp. Mgbs1]|uniref:Alpha-glutamyl/putrescinyl thymine pyrophosphorylase clade 3 domain-containing protein n=1 Tax=Chitinophaga solisilvae TaxID=1233460 RepID=A0A9Q5GQJ6_9BACT|nr:hypothetical protein [Chitinophaga solisilvae]
MNIDTYVRLNFHPPGTTPATVIEKQLNEYYQQTAFLPGVKTIEDRELFATCISKSLLWYSKWAIEANTSHYTANEDFSGELFDPFKQAIRLKNQGDSVEAWWLIFLATWFGKHSSTGWRLIKAVYHRLNTNNTWNWRAVIAAPGEFENWLLENQPKLLRVGKLGNHHKHQAFDRYQAIKTIKILGKFIEWWNIDHTDKIGYGVMCVGQSPRELFNYMNRHLNEVLVVAPQQHYNFLTWAGVLGLAELEPNKPYLSSGTVYKKAVRWFFYGKLHKSAKGKDLTQRIVELSSWLDIPFVFPVLEEALCNFYHKKSQ